MDKNKRKKSLIAINEISLFRQTKQTVNLMIKIGKKTLLKKLVGDGVLVSTPARARPTICQCMDQFYL